MSTNRTAVLVWPLAVQEKSEQSEWQRVSAGDVAPPKLPGAERERERERESKLRCTPCMLCNVDCDNLAPVGVSKTDK